MTFTPSEVFDFNAPYDLMKFPLKYDGELRTTGNGRGKRKTPYLWKIRKELHPQIGGQFLRHPTFRHECARGRFEQIQVKGHNFIPLVRAGLQMRCGLDIQFLRKEGSLIQGGDIDNRLKTLFDALRMPHPTNSERIPDDEIIPDPMFVLLEDDCLITRLSINTGDLLDGEFNRAQGNLGIFPWAKPKDEVTLIMDVDISVVGGGSTPLGQVFLE